MAEKKNDVEVLDNVKKWLENQLKTLVKIPAVSAKNDEIIPSKTAILTARLANEYKKLISTAEEKNDEDEILKILKG